MSIKETGTQYKIQKDEYNYVWVVLADPDFEDLVTNIQMVSQILMEQGFGTQLLAAVYRFRGEEVIYWIYNFKQGSYYPLCRQTAGSGYIKGVPVKALMEKEMPIEKDESRWYPMWGMPL